LAAIARTAEERIQAKK
jgi:hypothetical protein